MSKWKILKFLQASPALESCHLFLYITKRERTTEAAPICCAEQPAHRKNMHPAITDGDDLTQTRLVLKLNASSVPDTSLDTSSVPPLALVFTNAVASGEIEFAA